MKTMAKLPQNQIGSAHSRGVVLTFLFLLLFSPIIHGQQPVAKPAAPAQEDVLSYADLLYSQKQYGVAAQQYQIYIKENPKSPNIQAGWFRLGECYLQVGQETDAETTFNHLIKTYKRGAFVGSSAYRLAVIRFNAKDYKNALGYFRLATSELTNPEASLQSRFYYARSLQLTKQPELALVEYEAIMKTGAAGVENPFQERCLLESARLLFDLGDLNKALEKFEELAKTAKTQKFKEEALVRGGLLAAEAGKPEISEKFLDQALRFSDTSPWKSLAKVGSIFNAFTRKDYDKVISLYIHGGTSGVAEDSRAKMLLIVAHSFRIKGDLENALRIYSLVEGKFANQPEGAEAGYRKLQLLHQKGDNTLPVVAEEYALKISKVDKNSKFIDMAYLMKAEWHFKRAETSASGPGSEFAKKHYSSAAKAYEAVRDTHIDKKYQITRLYKQGWSQIEADLLKEGVATLSQFIKLNPKHALASSALAKRGAAHLSLDDHPGALVDFSDIVAKYPQAPELEYAMQQVALLYGHKREIPEMIAGYLALLKRFPETTGKAEAHYWIGAGNFDLEKYDKAVPELKTARDLDPAGFGDKATLRLVLAHYYNENVDELVVEARRYIETAPAPPGETGKKEKDAKAIAMRSSIPPQVLEYLGRKLAEKKDYANAEFFLTELSNPESPEKTSALIWKLLAECRMKIKKFAEAVPAFDNFLIQTQRPSERAAAYLQRGKAQLCLKDFEASRKSARESLRSQKEGRTNAEARILMGDIAAKDGDLEGAAREYLVVSQIFMDREVTPIALSKAINAYLSLGKKEQAEKLSQQLKKSFPNYKAPAKMDDGC